MKHVVVGPRAVHHTHHTRHTPGLVNYVVFLKTLSAIRCIVYRKAESPCSLWDSSRVIVVRTRDFSSGRLYRRRFCAAKPRHLCEYNKTNCRRRRTAISFPLYCIIFFIFHNRALYCTAVIMMRNLVAR